MSEVTSHLFENVLKHSEKGEIIYLYTQVNLNVVSFLKPSL